MTAHEDLNLTPEQLRYLDWLTTPRGERQPSSKAKYAKQHGHDVTTLRRWEKREQFAKELEQRLRYLTGGAERVRDGLDKLYADFMESGDHRKLELWLRATGNMHVEPQKVEVRAPITDLSDDELNALLNEELQKERKRRADACRKDFKIGEQMERVAETAEEAE